VTFSGSSEEGATLLDPKEIPLRLEHAARKWKRISYRATQWGWKRVAWVLTRAAIDTFAYLVWDVWHGVETRKEVALRHLGIEGACYGDEPEAYMYSGWNGDYSCASPKLPERIKRLNLDWNSFAYLDLGSGKGKSLLMAAQIPFAKVIGIEISPKLVTVAQKNLARHRNFDLKCKDIELVLQDATTYDFPRYPLVMYSLNTFPPAVMRVVLANLGRSLEQHPREAYLISTPTPPEIESLFSECGFLKLVDSGPSYQSYRALLTPATHT
jgi:hypothetical protein